MIWLLVNFHLLVWIVWIYWGAFGNKPYRPSSRIVGSHRDFIVNFLTRFICFLDETMWRAAWCYNNRCYNMKIMNWLRTNQTFDLLFKRISFRISRIFRMDGEENSSFVSSNCSDFFHSIGVNTSRSGLLARTVGDFKFNRRDTCSPFPAKTPWNTLHTLSNSVCAW